MLYYSNQLHDDAFRSALLFSSPCMYLSRREMKFTHAKRSRAPRVYNIFLLSRRAA
jgi:hypothetical protein